MKAVFLDRDGVINELICYPEQGTIDSPATAEQFRLLPGAGEAVNRFHDMGFTVVLVSNQPGIAKGKMTAEGFEKIRDKMAQELAKSEASIDAEYYCFHHSEAIVQRFKADCECRKPKPGLLLRAAGEMGIDLPGSWMIGDGLTDVKAGREAGCRTILLGRMKCELCRFMDEDGARPDAIVANLEEAAQYIQQKGGCNGDIR